MGINYEQAFQGLNEATADDRLPKYTNGDFRLCVTSLETSDHDEYGLSVFVECDVMASTNEKYPAGLGVSTKVGNLSATKKSSKERALKNLKQLLAALLCIDPDSPQNWVGLLQMCEQHKLLVGATFFDDDVITAHTKADGAGKSYEYIRHNYRADPSNPRSLEIILGELQVKLA